jgi:hypothetical protein
VGEAARAGRWLTGSPDRHEVERVLAEASAGRGRRAAPAAPVRRAGDAAVADRSAAGALSVPEELAGLLPSGLRRGATVMVTGSTSLLLLLLAGAMTGTDLWSAVVGAPNLGLVAAAEMGVPLDRLALVPHPGPDLPGVVGALVDGMSLVAATAPAGVSEATARALSGRARSRGCVLVVGQKWPGVDLEIGADGRCWTGLGEGRGRLRYCEFDVEVRGRGSAARPRRATIRLPRAAGTDSVQGWTHQDGAPEQRWKATGGNSPTGSPSPWQLGRDGMVGLPDQAQRAG